jgi:hypothetical protein
MSVKVTKEIASRAFVPSFSGAVTSRGEDSGTEAVHTIVADRDTAGNRYLALAQKQTRNIFRHRAPDYAPPLDDERRKNDRRQRQDKVVLDTRVASSRRQNQAIDEEI